MHTATDRAPDIAILSPLGRNPGVAHGGITPVVLTLYQAFVDAGCTTELLILAPEGPQTEQPRQWPALLTAPPRVRNLGAGPRWLQAHRLRNYVQNHRPQAILSAGHKYNLLAIASADKNHRTLISVHNSLKQSLAQLHPPKRLLRHLAIRTRYPLANKIVCVSAGLADELQALAPKTADRCQVIHNPIPTPSSENEAPLHPWLSDKKTPIILAAGRLTAQKDFTTLLRAFARLQHHPPARLLILGEGSERATLLDLARRLGIAERVDLPGFVPNPRAHMAGANLFVLSSVWEGFGNVLVEAMSVGTSVIATDCPSGPSEILRGGKLAPLVPCRDPEALCRAMEQRLAAPLDAGKLRQRAADFSPQRISRRYLELLLPERFA
jgi:glycosyltransferase involved in cell wall biosynthesis